MFIKKDRYVDLWPKSLDIEAFFTKAVLGFVAVLGVIAKILDGVLLDWMAVENILKFFNGFTKIPEQMPERMVKKLRDIFYEEVTEAPEQELVNKLHAQYDRKVDTLRLIGSSLSFGLLLACIGLIMTIVYVLIN